MSSPTSASGKRKRSASQTLSVQVPKPDFLQPSSRDASGEDGGDESTGSAIPSPGRQQQLQTSAPGATGGAVPAAKRARTSSVSNGATDAKSNQDPGEPSETTSPSSDIENDDERTSDAKRKALEPPERAGLMDPVGYSTNPPPVGRPIRVYADGVFDLFHMGHMRQLEQAKKAFPDVYLMVGVTGDKETHDRKGLTVLSGAERAETIRHCKWVDEVVPNCPWVVTPEFIDEHQIDYVAHDDLPYGAAEGDDIYAPIKAQGKFLVTQRTEGVSTTGIITRIVRDYDQYISRQFKRGASRQELNVSWLKKNELEVKRHVSEIRDNIRYNWASTGQELGRELRQFWQSRPGSPAPSARNSLDLGSRGVTSPTGNGPKSHLSRVESISRPESPMGNGRNEDFATGYSLGLVGGVRAWMMRTRRSLMEQPSRPQSPTSEEEHETDQDARRRQSETHANTHANTTPVHS